MSFLTLNQVNGMGNIASAHKWELILTSNNTSITSEELSKLSVMCTEVNAPTQVPGVQETIFRGYTHRQVLPSPNGGSLSIAFPEDENGTITGFFRKLERLYFVQGTQKQSESRGLFTATVRKFKSDNTLIEIYKYYNVGLTSYTPGALSSDIGLITASAEFFYSHFDHNIGEEVSTDNSYSEV